jgi:hypothetical protein
MYIIPVEICILTGIIFISNILRYYKSVGSIMKKIIIVAIFLANANIESYYIYIPFSSYIFKQSVAVSFPAEQVSLIKTLPALVNRDACQDIPYILDTPLGESKKGEWDKWSTEVIINGPEVNNSNDYYHPSKGLMNSFVHNRFFTFKTVVITEETFTEIKEGKKTFCGYKESKSKYLVWDEKTHTNLKYSAALLGAIGATGLAYAAYNKWFK